MTAADIIEALDLKPLTTEGGFFRETYRSPELITQKAVPARYSHDRHIATAIYYLLTPEVCSKIHRVKSDEIFHFYMGDPVKMVQLHPDGEGTVITIGNAIEKGECPQVVVPHMTWQGAFLAEGGSYALMGTTVSPGFDYDDFEQGDQEVLLQTYPSFAEHIKALS